MILALGLAITALPAWAQFGSTGDREKGIVIYLSQTAYLTYFDLALLCLCPVFGALGGVVSRHLTLADIRSKLDSNSHLSENTTADTTQTVKYQPAPHFGPNAVLVGAILGIVVALYFVGAITDHVTSLARVFALCILLGYQASNLWRAQEKIIASLVDDRLRTLLGDKNFIGIRAEQASEHGASQDAPRTK
ncbi:hypothetical protein ACG04Q_13510 [Roseateles sp. DXS20W]|uniref:MotA/TolQ/ExbB proton channel domain-containing protein n=1 Tax=Pelomonas lactea TaxID=3299030 RepID=A0ABW7GKU8_9BURK